MAPIYLCELLEVYEPTRSLRSSSKNLLRERKARTKAGERAFAVCGPKLWNQLPLSVRNCDSVSEFKGALKTYLFREAYIV